MVAGPLAGKIGVELVASVRRADDDFRRNDGADGALPILRVGDVAGGGGADLQRRADDERPEIDAGRGEGVGPRRRNRLLLQLLAHLVRPGERRPDRRVARRPQKRRAELGFQHRRPRLVLPAPDVLVVLLVGVVFGGAENEIDQVVESALLRLRCRAARNGQDGNDEEEAQNLHPGAVARTRQPRQPALTRGKGGWLTRCCRGRAHREVSAAKPSRRRLDARDADAGLGIGSLGLQDSRPRF